MTSSASASVGGRALGRGGRVVELVREPRRHRAERLQPLAVLLGAGRRVITGFTWRMTRSVHRRMRERQAAEVVGAG